MSEDVKCPETERGEAMLTLAAEILRQECYSPRTEQAYLRWLRRFLRYCRRRPGSEARSETLVAYLEELAAMSSFGAASHNQASAALLFFHHRVLGKAEAPRRLRRTPRSRRLPQVLGRWQVEALLQKVPARHRLVLAFVYGAGLRLTECLALRVGDLDLEGRRVVVSADVPEAGRRTVLPESLVEPVVTYLDRLRRRWRQDLRQGVAVRGDLRDVERGAWGVYPLWPARRLVHAGGRRWRGSRSGREVQRQLRAAASALGLPSRVDCRTLRDSFAVHLLMSGCSVRTVQRLLGHRHVRTTRRYQRLLAQGGRELRSPLDLLDWRPREEP